MFLLRKISGLTLIIYGAIASLLGLSIAVSLTGSESFSFGALVYYAGIVVRSLETSILFSLYFLLVFLVFLVAFSNARNFYNVIARTGNPPTILGKTSLREALKEVWSILYRGLIAIAPAILFVFVLSFFLSRINAIDEARLMDVGVIGWEHAVFGAYAFAALGAVHYPIWFVDAVVFSFKNMSGAVIIAGFIVTALHRDTIREMVAAFCLAMFVAAIFWIMVPALSPQDRFIDNVYGLPISPALEQAVAAYHPQPEIAGFLGEVRREKSDLANLPTSTLPSAHIIWAVLTGYYLSKSRRWLGWAALPFLAASSFGTILLAQHYVADIVLGAIVAVFSIRIVDMVARRSNR